MRNYRSWQHTKYAAMLKLCAQYLKYNIPQFNNSSKTVFKNVKTMTAINLFIKHFEFFKVEILEFLYCNGFLDCQFQFQILLVKFSKSCETRKIIPGNRVSGGILFLLHMAAHKQACMHIRSHFIDVKLWHLTKTKNM